jgi:hypothetical protein
VRMRRADALICQTLDATSANTPFAGSHDDDQDLHPRRCPKYNMSGVREAFEEGFLSVRCSWHGRDGGAGYVGRVAVNGSELSIFVLLAARGQITLDDLGNADIAK